MRPFFARVQSLCVVWWCCKHSSLPLGLYSTEPGRFNAFSVSLFVGEISWPLMTRLVSVYPSDLCSDERGPAAHSGCCSAFRVLPSLPTCAQIWICSVLLLQEFFRCCCGTLLSHSILVMVVTHLSWSFYGDVAPRPAPRPLLTLRGTGFIKTLSTNYQTQSARRRGGG